MTPKGSVPFNREYGTTLYSLLFENNVDPADIVAFIYADIEDNEPRVELSPADIYIYKTDRNTYEVNVTFFDNNRISLHQVSRFVPHLSYQVQL